MVLRTSVNGVNQIKKNFKFPLEDDGYKGRITFEAIQENYKTLPETVFSGLVEAASQTTNRERATQPETGFKGQQKTVRGNIPARVGSGRKATMYLPSTLQFQDNIEYTNVDLGIIGSAAAKALGDPNASGKTILNAIKNNITPDFASIQEAFNVGPVSYTHLTLPTILRV